MRPSTRLRVRYIARAFVTIAVGLVVHLRGAALGPTLRDVAGDALWATMIVWWVGAFAPLRSLGWRAGVALAICVVVESSQAYHTPGLDAVRATGLGHLVLGSDFDVRDLGAYALGVVMAVLIERFGGRVGPAARGVRADGG